MLALNVVNAPVLGVVAPTVPLKAPFVTPFSVRVLVPAVLPIAMAVVLPVSPPVPMFNVFVLPLAVAPASMLMVLLTVDCPKVRVPVVAVPPIITVPVVRFVPRVCALVPAPDITAEPVLLKAVNVGLLFSTTAPVPVFVENSVMFASQSVTAVEPVAIHLHMIVHPTGPKIKNVPALVWTVSTPVELLQSENCHPVSSVEVTGSKTVCAVDPVKI